MSAGPHGIEDTISHLLKETQEKDAATRSGADGSSAIHFQHVATDLHHKVPEGCSVPQTTSTLTGEVVWIGDTGIALGDFDAGNPQIALTHVDAILNCGLKEHYRYWILPFCSHLEFVCCHLSCEVKQFQSIPFTFGP